MKLNILPPVEAPKNPIKRKTGFESPLGWWKVTTEGDCEGRSTRHIGNFYGHVAEIALYAADQCCYALSFEPLEGAIPSERHTYRATKSDVWIQLGVGSNTWGMSYEERAKWIGDWMDAHGQIDVLPNDGKVWYYAGVYLKYSPKTLTR